MATGRFIAYQPTALQVVNGKLTQADAASIRADLTVLRPRFDGLITYGALGGAERVPDIAATLGFRAVIVGVWDITSRQELANALAAARRQPQIVVGLSIGNELIFAKDHSVAEVAAAIDAARRQAPKLALTTTEPFHIFLEARAKPLLHDSDFVLANVHPVFQPWWRKAPDANAADFVVNVVDKLAGIACGPVLVKETGVPTAPADAGFTPARQAAFYQALAQRFPPSAARAFAYFSAFDAPWRVNDKNPVPGVHPEEAHWGLFDANRQPKPAVAEIPPLPKPGG
jgi:exo-beta-1,3-glucanase (GH17 family)